MRDSVILELAEKWEREAREPLCQNGSEEAKIPNAIADGERRAQLKCANDIRALIALIGE